MCAYTKNLVNDPYMCYRLRERHHTLKTFTCQLDWTIKGGLSLWQPSLFTHARWGNWELQNQTTNQTKVSFVGQSWCRNLDPRVLSYPSRWVEERTWERGYLMSMMLRVTSVEMLHKTQIFVPFDPKCWYNVRKIKKDNLPYVFSRVLHVRFFGVFKNIR